MKKIILLFFIISYSINTLTADKTFTLSSSKLNSLERKYGQKARKRFERWDALIQSLKHEKTLVKLKKVNDFFNSIRYSTDIRHWGANDYWATPFEFIGTGSGDCEDYAIAKYFTLRQLGIPDRKLRITYVIYRGKRSRFDQAHMVLSYLHKPNATPVILGNINKKLKLATKRKDLKPVYSFNAKGLWQAQTRGDKRVGSNNLRMWKKLMSRN